MFNGFGGYVMGGLVSGVGLGLAGLAVQGVYGGLLGAGGGVGGPLDGEVVRGGSGGSGLRIFINFSSDGCGLLLEPAPRSAEGGGGGGGELLLGPALRDKGVRGGGELLL